MKQIGNWIKNRTLSMSMQSWKNKKTTSYLYLYRENFKEDKFNKKGELWKVWVGKASGQEKINLGEFETKKTAIEFIEKWMKDNQGE